MTLDGFQLVEILITSIPKLVAHADWGSAPSKRWLCVAQRDSAGLFQVSAPELVGDSATLIARLRIRAQGNVLLGFDFPIGVPVAFARRFGITKFTDVLLRLGADEFAEFFDLAEIASDISPARPFYPRRPGGTRRQHLVDGLGVSSYDQLLRECEAKNPTRAAACALFWTLGGNQVGRAAILGWKDVLQPALRDPGFDLAIWPFNGALFDLINKHDVVIAETYPAEACLHLNVPAPGRGWSKRSQFGRRSQAPALRRWANSRGVLLSDALTAQLQDGFGPTKDAEDPFDATVGLFSMIEVVLGHRPPGDPTSPEVRNVEGWILGQAPRRAGDVEETIRLTEG